MALSELAENILHNPSRLLMMYGDRYPLLPTGELQVPRDEGDAALLEALKYRFDTLRDKIPLVQRLADSENISEIKDFHDVVPLLFSHTMYKSYPPSLLEKRRFDQIVRWLDRLTSHDLSEVDVSDCNSIDDWLRRMDETPVCVATSTGTTGTMSFLPLSWTERAKFGSMRRDSIIYADERQILETGGQIPDLYVLYPWFRDGLTAQTRNIQNFVDFVLPADDRIRALYPLTLSADVAYLSGRIAAAQATGTLDRLDVTEYQKERKAAFDDIVKDHDQHLRDYAVSVAEELEGKRIFTMGVWSNLYNMAKAGVDAGKEMNFSPTSIIRTGGGAKNQTPAEDWREVVKRYIGTEQMFEQYGMSEVIGGAWKCSESNYHMHPTLVPFVLDPNDSSKALPRKGTTTGRMAFFDLGADARWGGFITRDHVTMEWDKVCACGRPSRYISSNVERFSEQQGGDDKISCAASPNAHREAMDFLSKIGAN